jgi:ribosomal protein S10
MRYYKFILESNSNKLLESHCKSIILAIKTTGAVARGPIPSKGKRIIYCYNPSFKTIDALIRVKTNKKRVSISFWELKNSSTQV